MSAPPSGAGLVTFIVEVEGADGLAAGDAPGTLSLTDEAAARWSVHSVAAWDANDTPLSASL
ncbi:hypothetical protein L6R49_28435, partial [Myxococcota bacterium]|nr:hypothetical protein [Myxococcota bacterium]